MTLEDTLTSRDNINASLRTVLDEATGRHPRESRGAEGDRPPVTIQEAMEKQMRAEPRPARRHPHGGGVKQPQILTAEGEKQSSILRAEGQKQSEILRAEGASPRRSSRSSTRSTVATRTRKLLAYQYLQTLPQIAQGESNKVWIIPSEVTQALANIGSVIPRGERGPRRPRRARRAPRLAGRGLRQLRAVGARAPMI